MKKIKGYVILLAVVFIAFKVLMEAESGVDSVLGSRDDFSSKSISEIQGIYTAWGQSDAAQPELSSDLLAKNYYIILDTSGSMAEAQCVRQGNKMQAAKTSLSQWIGNVSAYDNIALAAFRGDSVQEVLPLRKNSPQYREQFMALMAKEHPSGNTPLGASLEKAYGALKHQAETQLGYGEYHIVVVTDGIASDAQKMDKAAGKLFRSPVILHTIGFCIDTQHALNHPGKSYYMSAMNEAELKQGLENVLAESEQYDISGFETVN